MAKLKNLLIPCILIYIQTGCKKQEAIIPNPSTIATQRLVNTAIPIDTSATVYIGGGDSMYAINAATGRTRWVMPYKIGFSTPTVNNGIVYVGSIDHNVYALDASTGAKKWQYMTGDDVESTPTVAEFSFSNSLVYIGSNDGNIYALDALTGSEKWHHHTNGKVRSSPTKVLAYLFIGSDDGNIYALNALTGVEKWKANFSKLPMYSNPTVNIPAASIYIGNDYDGSLYAFDALSGSINPTFTPPLPAVRAGTSSPTISNGWIYIAIGTDVYAIDMLTNKQQWVYPGGSYFISSSPIIYNNLLYIGTGEFLCALYANTGKEKWKSTSKIAVIGGPTVYNNTVYIVGYDYDTFYGAYLSAFNASTGDEKWRYKLDKYWGSSPCVVTADGIVYHPGISGDQP